MAQVELPTRSFASPAAWRRWLSREHARSLGIWLKIPKKGSGKSGPTYAEALDEALCYGWIDSQKNKYDEDYYVQRFTPRGPRSKWSKINCKKVEALIAAGRMTPAGQLEIEAAQEDGRWERAYDSARTASVPADLKAALEAQPRAHAFFRSLSGQNRFAILYRIQEAKRPDTRARRIAKFVEMCARGETVH